MYCKVFLLLVFAGSASCVQAQGVQVGPNGVRLVGFGDVDVDASIEHWTEIEGERIRTILDLRVELIRQECKLTDPQVEKLRLLIEGIVARKMSGGAEQLKKFMSDSRLVPKIAFNENSLNPKSELLVSGVHQDNGNPAVVVFRTQFKEPLFENSLWQGVLRSNLSDDQFALYEKSCLERNQRFVDAALSQALADLDEPTCLNSRQRELIKSEWHKAVASEVTIGYPTNMEEAVVLTHPAVSDRALITDILTEKQLLALDADLAKEQWQGVGWTAR